MEEEALRNLPQLRFRDVSGCFKAFVIFQYDGESQLWKWRPAVEGSAARCCLSSAANFSDKVPESGCVRGLRLMLNSIRLAVLDCSILAGC